MFFSEHLRSLQDEKALINDATFYGTSSTTWTTVKDYGNVTLSKAGILILKYQIKNNVTFSNHRISVGGIYAIGCPRSGTGTFDMLTMLALNAGTYNITAQAVNYSGGPDTTGIQNMRVGFVSFPDLTVNNLAVYSSQVTLIPPARRSFWGSVARVVLYIAVFAYTPGAQTNFENIGDNLTNGVSLLVNGNQVNWSERIHDNLASPYGAGSAWYRFATRGAGTDHGFTVNKRNVNTVVNISIILCPWILGDDSGNRILDLDFPQGSTLYISLEPLTADVTKYIKIGKPRWLSFGEATDYFSTASGTGILNHYYTFEQVRPSDCQCLLYGSGGCVARIALDVR